MVKITRDFNADLAPGSVPEAAKAVGATAITGASGLWRVPRKAIKVLEGFNVRADLPDYREHIAELAGSITTDGWYLDKPLACYVVKDGAKNVIYATEGHSRLAGYDLAVQNGAKPGDIPVVFAGKATSLKDLTKKMANANKHLAHAPYELAVIARRLSNYGSTPEEIAEEIGKTPRYVSDLLLLADAPAAVRSMVVRGQIAATEAVAQLRKHGPAAAEKLKADAEKAKARGKQRVTAKDTGRKPAPSPAPQQAAEPDQPELFPDAPRTASALPVPTDAGFLSAAIAYALDVAIDTRNWLASWRAGDGETVAELEAWMGQPPGAMLDPSLRVPEPPIEIEGETLAEPGEVPVESAPGDFDDLEAPKAESEEAPPAAEAVKPRRVRKAPAARKAAAKAAKAKPAKVARAKPAKAPAAEPVL